MDFRFDFKGKVAWIWGQSDQSWAFSQQPLITHDCKSKTVTPGKIENPQQDLKLLFNTTKYQFDCKPGHCHEYGGIKERLMNNELNAFSSDFKHFWLFFHRPTNQPTNGLTNQSTNGQKLLYRGANIKNFLTGFKQFLTVFNSFKQFLTGQNLKRCLLKSF